MTTATQQQYYSGTGKRKSAIAQVRLYPGGGVFSVNGRPLEEMLGWPEWRSKALQPLKVTNLQDHFSVVAKVEGGGVNGWADALRHGIARALLAYDVNLKKTLRDNGFLTRDARVKEAKKYGLKRARRAPQWTKR
jgi:small subunit ribosomal protein S9